MCFALQSGCIDNWYEEPIPRGLERQLATNAMDVFPYQQERFYPPTLDHGSRLQQPMFPEGCRVASPVQSMYDYQGPQFPSVSPVYRGDFEEQGPCEPDTYLSGPPFDLPGIERQEQSEPHYSDLPGLNAEEPSLYTNHEASFQVQGHLFMIA